MDLPDPGIKMVYPAVQVDSLPAEISGKHKTLKQKNRVETWKRKQNKENLGLSAFKKKNRKIQDTNRNMVKKEDAKKANYVSNHKKGFLQ